MIRIVSVYQTPDGRQFPTEQAAQRHATDVLLHKLEVFVEFAFPNAGHRPSVIQAVNLLEGNKQLTADLLRELLHVMAYGEDDNQ